MSAPLSNGSTAPIADPIEAWKERGRELNALYDVLRPAMGNSCTEVPLADLRTLVAERDRLRAGLRQVVYRLTAADGFSIACGAGAALTARGLAASALAEPATSPDTETGCTSDCQMCGAPAGDPCDCFDPQEARR